MSDNINNNDLLTIKEFAELAGVSVQSVYKRLNNSLNPYIQQVESQKMLKLQALKDIYNIEVEQPIKLKLNNPLNPNQSEEITFLRSQIEQLQSELVKEREHNREKDKQLFETLRKLADSQVALTAGQTAEKFLQLKDGRPSEPTEQKNEQTKKHKQKLIVDLPKPPNRWQRFKQLIKGE